MKKDLSNQHKLSRIFFGLVKPTFVNFFSNRSPHSGAISLATVLVIGGILFGSATASYKFMSMRRTQGKSLDGDRAENFNRRAILVFQTQWERGHFMLQTNRQSLTDLPMFETAALVERFAPNGNRTWRIKSNKFELFHCPPGHDYDPNPGVNLRPENATEADCIRNNIAIRSVVTPIELDASRNTILISAETTINSATLTQNAMMSVPQHQTIIDRECKLLTSTDNASWSETPSVSITANSRVYFKLEFAPRLMRDLRYFHDATEYTITAAQKASSPLLVDHVFPAAGGPYGVDIKFTVIGGAPCEPSVKVNVAKPPEKCKWSDPSYFEDYTVDVCVISPYGRGRVAYSLGTAGLRVGINQGDQASLATWSGNYHACLPTNAQHCRTRIFAAPVSYSTLTSTNNDGCLQAKNGSLKSNEPLYMLAKFEYTDPPTGSNDTCKVTVVRIRSPQDGCFPKGIKIRRADGGLVAVENVRTGDLLWNPHLERPVRVSEVIAGMERSPLWLIKTHAGDIRLTGNHPILTKRGMVPADTVVADDIILSESKHWLIVKESTREMISKDNNSEGEMVYNFIVDNPSSDPSQSVDDTHVISADGMMVGDWTIQTMKDKSKKSDSSR
jgi:hypothetical protein